MIAVQVFLILSLYIYVLFRLPELRLAGTIVAVTLIGGLIYYMVTVPPEPQAEVNRIPISDVTLQNVELELGPRTAMLSGRAINGSPEFTLTGINLDVTLYDCPGEDTPFSDCFTIGEDDGYARLTAPPGQLRDFKATLLFTDLPKVTGVQRWQYQITGTRALDTSNR